MTDQQTIKLLFALLRSAVFGVALTDGERALYTEARLPELLATAKKHDVTHLLAHALKSEGLVPQDHAGAEKQILQAVFRCERLEFEYTRLCAALEEAEVRFVPLKGAVLRREYPETWMRTSCDIDILVRREELEKAVSYLCEHLGYEEQERATHDVSFYSPQGNHIELHFDLVEEDCAQNANGVLRDVWACVTLCADGSYRYQMSDAFFYFYHIAHMAKHFESGGCGIRPLIDLWILEHLDGADRAERERLLADGGLLQFAQTARRLCEVWFGGAEMDDLSLQMQAFILTGGVYGTAANRVALHQRQRGGRFGYLLSRIFVPYERLKRYYPVLEKHRFLTPLMQVRRWFMLLRPSVRAMAKRELRTNYHIDSAHVEEMNVFLENIGLLKNRDN